MEREGDFIQIDREMVEARAQLARARQTVRELTWERTNEPRSGWREAWAAERAAEERFRDARIRSYLAGMAPRAYR